MADEGALKAHADAHMLQLGLDVATIQVLCRSSSHVLSAGPSVGMSGPSGGLVASLPRCFTASLPHCLSTYCFALRISNTSKTMERMPARRSCIALPHFRALSGLRFRDSCRTMIGPCGFRVSQWTPGFGTATPVAKAIEFLDFFRWPWGDASHIAAFVNDEVAPRSISIPPYPSDMPSPPTIPCPRPYRCSISEGESLDITDTYCTVGDCSSEEEWRSEDGQQARGPTPRETEVLPRCCPHLSFFQPILGLVRDPRLDGVLKI